MPPSTAPISEVAEGPPLAALAALAASPFADLEEAIAATLDLIANLFGLELAMVQRLDDDRLVITHLCDRIGLGVQPPIAIRRADTFCDGVLASISALLVPDADADDRFVGLPGKQMIGTRTYIGVPILLSDRRLYGTLCAHDRRVLDLGKTDIEAFVVLARLVASQIERHEAALLAAENARQLAARNAELNEAVRQLDALREVVESISSELNLQALLQRVVASAADLLHAEGGAISLFGDDPAAPRRLTATYNLPEIPGGRDAPGTSGLMGQVLAARGPVIVDRYDDLDAPLPDSVFHRLAPWVAVPIWWQGDIVGTFGIGGNDPVRRFGEREVELLTLLAKHAAVAIANARLYAASHDLGAAEERNRLAREIHDTLAQSLLGLTFQLRTARGLVERAPARATTELIEAEERTRAALEEARRSVWNLGPVSLETSTLVEAFQGEVAAAERAGLPGKLIVTGAARPLPAEAQLALFRVAQEAIANARKHARASCVQLALAYGPFDASLAVTDDGVGFDADLALRRGASTGGFGLGGMVERVREVGGRLVIDSARGRGGTRVLATVPYESATEIASSDAAPPPIGARVLRVVVADDHPVTRAGMVAVLEEQPDIAVVGEAADGEAALRLVGQLRPDVLVTDLRMPKLSGVDAIGRVAALDVPTRVIAVTAFAQDELVFQALRAGARGYLLKDASGEELAAAVRTVSAGGAVFTPAAASKLAGSFGTHSRLTDREREVLALLARGMPDKEIAARLGTSAKTVSFHVTNLLAKLGAQNRTEAVRLAYDRGLLSDEG